MQYEELPQKYRSSSEVPKGKDIFYRCDVCQIVIPSLPKDSVSCTCGRVGIDVDAWRLWIDEPDKFTVLKGKK
ncbi:MAG: hypothetical protein A4S17_12310 [Proteobacteria bacterium HN_bin10]|nr:MAG: hypothetical protein A4S17_12310 [Proteobacteria bacterium HN_bin10]